MSIKAVVFDAYGTLYDIQSVAEITEDAFPGYGEIITQVWRIKQLEYTWLRSLMRRYQDFAAVTRDSLAYTLRLLGLAYEGEAFERVIEKYLDLDLYPDAAAALAALKPRKLAILSNGSPDMLNALVRNSGLDRLLDATISVDAKKVFKPSPEAYTLIGEVFGTRPDEVLFVSSNPWDAAGAKSKTAVPGTGRPTATTGDKDVQLATLQGLWNLKNGKDLDRYVNQKIQVTGRAKNDTSGDKLKGTTGHELDARDFDVKSVTKVADSCS